MSQILEIKIKLETINQELKERIKHNLKMYIDGQMSLRDLMQDYNEISSLIKGVEGKLSPDLIYQLMITLSQYEGVIVGINARIQYQKQVYAEFDKRNKEN